MSSSTPTPALPEELTKEVVLSACEQLDFHVEDHRAASRHSIEFGKRARVERLPGVPGGSSFLGTFSPCCRQIRSTRLWFTCQPVRLNMPVTLGEPYLPYTHASSMIRCVSGASSSRTCGR